MVLRAPAPSASDIASHNHVYMTCRLSMQDLSHMRCWLGSLTWYVVINAGLANVLDAASTPKGTKDPELLPCQCIVSVNVWQCMGVSAPHQRSSACWDAKRADGACSWLAGYSKQWLACQLPFQCGQRQSLDRTHLRHVQLTLRAQHGHPPPHQSACDQSGGCPGPSEPPQGLPTSHARSPLLAPCTHITAADLRGQAECLDVDNQSTVFR